MKQKPSGVQKRVSEPFYPKDWLSDHQLRSAPPLIRGLWFDALCLMWLDKVYKITKTKTEWARFWGATLEEVEQFIEVAKALKFCDVTISNGNVTLVCRRLKRRAQARTMTRDRVKKHRVKRSSNADVTPPYSVPSSSLSVSSSVSPSKEGKNPPAPQGGVDISACIISEFATKSNCPQTAPAVRRHFKKAVENGRMSLDELREAVGSDNYLGETPWKFLDDRWPKGKQATPGSGATAADHLKPW